MSMAAEGNRRTPPSTKESAMHDTLPRLFRYKAWANDELLTALARLGDAPSITDLAIRAMHHSHVVDRIFAAHLQGRPHPYTSTNPEPLPSLEALSADIRACDRDYLDYVPTLDRAQLAERINFVFTDGAAGCMSREEMLLHVITHGVGHRGQVSALMLLNARPPAPDGFTAYLHMAEASARGRASA
jgi:uncharacterized damage-inducible protein DinB